MLAATDHRFLACSGMVPMVDPGGARSYMAASDQATDDFFYSLTNQHSRKQDWPVTNAEDIIDFYTDGEPWLYDRAQTFYNDYLRTGNPDMLREAHRATDHYAHRRIGSISWGMEFGVDLAGGGESFTERHRAFALLPTRSTASSPAAPTSSA